VRPLFVFYDDSCGVCCRVAEWLRAQPSFVPLAVLPASQSPATGRDELLVVDGDGGVYRDTDAWLMTLWALRDFRHWAMRLAASDNRQFARKVVELAGSWRHGLSNLFRLTSEVELTRQLEVLPSSAACEVPVCRSCGTRTAPGHSLCPRCLSSALHPSS
jgi:ribosomal protein L40E